MMSQEAAGSDSWGAGLLLALRIIAGLGALLMAVQLVASVFAQDMQLKFGHYRLGGARLGGILAVLLCVLVGVSLLAQYWPVAAAGCVVGLAGTVASAWGLLHGGSGGPAPAAYWWVLAACGLAVLVVTHWASSTAGG